MFFPISGAHISPIYLAVVGFFIGILGGFFGVGGSFIAGPALRAVGLDWNFAVGTDLAHIVGKSVVAAKRHRALGNVDLKLGLIMAFGTIGGAEVGAQLIQMLKRAGNVNLVVSIVSIVVYISISSFMIWESRKTLRSKKGGTVAPRSEEHTSELQSPCNLVCRLLLEKKKNPASQSVASIRSISSYYATARVY